MRLSKADRLQRILARLNSEVTVRISTLAAQFGVTAETIRRDIDELTEQGLVSRTYGGAASRSLAAEPNLVQRGERYVAVRKRVARLALSLVEPGDVLMVDSGSTTYQFAHALAARSLALTILTNSLPIAQCLGGISSLHVTLCPGTFSAAENAVYGQETAAFLERFYASKTLIGAGGITENSVTDADVNAGWVKRKMIQRSQRTILLLDHSKYDTPLFDNVCALTDIADLITDVEPPAPIARALDAAAVRTHIAA